MSLLLTSGFSFKGEGFYSWTQWRHLSIKCLSVGRSYRPIKDLTNCDKNVVEWAAALHLSCCDIYSKRISFTSAQVSRVRCNPLSSKQRNAVRHQVRQSPDLCQEEIAKGEIIPAARTRQLLKRIWPLAWEQQWPIQQKAISEGLGLRWSINLFLATSNLILQFIGYIHCYGGATCGAGLSLQL